ncbi:MAG: AAA family ATPase, partial [Paludibacteraceae bacterium]|nr:AAA family ATPase [Paludibacteraceae bacterium]
MTNQRLQMAYDYAVYTHRNIFLTGKAGTGKTTLLHHLKDQCRKRIVVVAPTGVAAINAGGVTIHSFFQIAPGLHLPDNKVNRNRQNQLSKAKLKTIRSIDLLIIDEISMVRCDLLDEIDATLRRVRHDQRPFAGIQMLLIGDMQQLAPVTSETDWELLRPYYRTPYFFSSTALMKTDYVTIELDTVFRQQDEDFVDILNHVRDNTLSAQMLLKLNARYNPTFNPPDKDHYITLTTHNHQAAGINSIKLESLKAPSVIFEARIEGDFPATSYPNDASLKLKVGTQVMFCKNDPDIERRFYNGKIGTIEGIDEYDQR